MVTGKRNLTQTCQIFMFRNNEHTHFSKRSNVTVQKSCFQGGVTPSGMSRNQLREVLSYSALVFTARVEF